MRGDVKNLFERYCESKNTSPHTLQEMEPLLRDFLEVLNQDLVRAFYLKRFSRIQADIPDLIEPFHQFLNTLPPLEDSRFQELQTQTAHVSAERKALLQEYLELYRLVRDEKLIAFQNDPTKAQLLQLANEFEAPFWLEKLNHFELDSKKIYDSLYYQMAKKFIGDFENVKSKIQNKAFKEQELQTIQHHLIASLYHLMRRGEMGMELTELALTGRLSFLCYAELLAKPEEALLQMLPNLLVISQWDWLHDNKLLQKGLFLEIRKKSTTEIQKELNDRREMVQLLEKLSNNRWIDRTQMESLLKNSFAQLATKTLESLRIFIIKKEIGPFVQEKAKGTADEKEIMDQLSTLMKSGEALKAFYNLLLGNADSLKARFHELPLEMIQKFLNAATQKIAPKEPAKKKDIFEKMEKVLKAAKKKPAETKATAAPTPASNPAYELVSEIELLQKQLLENANVMDEFMSSHQQQGTAIPFLENHPILLPTTEQFFRTKLQILEQHVQKGKKKNNAAPMLGKLKIAIHENQQLDTQFLILQATLQQLPPPKKLTEEESALIQNVDIPIEERKFLIELCHQKYQFLHQLQRATSEHERWESLQLETTPPALVYILQDIFKEEPFYFTKAQLDLFQNFLPQQNNESLALSRENSVRLYEISMTSALFEKLVPWGFWQLEGASQSRLLESLKKNFYSETLGTSQWNRFQSFSVSKQSLETIVSAVSPKLATKIDPKGKKILSTMQAVLVKNDEVGLKNIHKKDVEYLANSLMATDYMAQIQELFEHFSEAETAESPQPFEEILKMEFHDQRLELLLQELTEIFPPDSPVIETGKTLYKGLTGFEY